MEKHPVRPRPRQLLTPTSHRFFSAGRQRCVQKRQVEEVLTQWGRQKRSCRESIGTSEWWRLGLSRPGSGRLLPWRPGGGRRMRTVPALSMHHCDHRPELAMKTPVQIIPSHDPWSVGNYNTPCPARSSGCKGAAVFLIAFYDRIPKIGFELYLPSLNLLRIGCYIRCRNKANETVPIFVPSPVPSICFQHPQPSRVFTHLYCPAPV